jgi:hypothetical protein
MRQWLPKYLRWYLFAFGSELEGEELAEAAADVAARNNRTDKNEDK